MPADVDLQGIAAKLMALAPGGAANVAGPIDELDGNLAQVVQRAESLRSRANALKGQVDRVIALLNRPREVADRLQSLSSSLENIRYLLYVTSIVRVIRPVADQLRRQIDVLKNAALSAEGKARALDRAVEPLRSALRKLSQTLGTVVGKLDQVIGHTQQARDKVGTVKRCMQGLPAGAARDRGLQLLDDFARTVNPLARSAAEALATADNAAAAVARDLAALEGQLDQLRSTVIAGIDAVSNALSPITGPLNELARVLDYRVNLYAFSFTLRQILDGIKIPYPFNFLEEQFWNLADSILQPILRTLHLDVLLPSIPGLDLLDRIRPDLPSIGSLDVGIGNITTYADNLRGMLDRFDVQCPPRAGQATFSELLLADLAAAEPKLIVAVGDENEA